MAKNTFVAEVSFNIKPITYRNCVLSTITMIDILVTISTAVGTGCNFPRGEVGSKFHHIRTYNRLSISYLYL